MIKQQFLSEAEILKTINERSPNTSTELIDTLEINDTAYIVLRDIPYPTLKSFIEGHSALDFTTITTLFNRLLNAVENLHTMGLIHRDIKPSNLFILPERIVIGDFGAARNYDPHTSNEYTMMFTEAYSAPEQKVREGNIGPWSDIYAIGCILEGLLTKASKSDSKLIKKHFPNDFRQRLTTEDPHQRFQSISAIRNALVPHKPKGMLKVIITNSLARPLIGLMILILLFVTFFQNNPLVLENQSPQASLLSESPNLEVSWPTENTHTGYIVTLTNVDTWAVYFAHQKCLSNTLDLSYYALPPGNYRLYVEPLDQYGQPLSSTYLDFTRPSYISPLSKPQTPSKTLYSTQEKMPGLAWTLLNDKTTQSSPPTFEVQVIQVKNAQQELINRPPSLIKTQTNTLDLAAYIKDAGEYRIHIYQVTPYHRSLPETVTLYHNTSHHLYPPIIENKVALNFYSNSQITLQWQKEPLAKGYELQIYHLATNTNYSQPIYLDEETTEYTLTNMLLSHGNYIVNLRYKTHSGAWSDSSQYTFNYIANKKTP